MKHPKHHVKKLNKKVRGLSSRNRFMLFVVSFGVIGAIALLIARAATPTASFESEAATLTQGAAIVTDSNASGGSAIQFNLVTAGTWSDSNQPWVLKSGESLDENVPAGVTIYKYEDFSNGGTRTFTQTLSAIRSSSTSFYYVRLPAGTYNITDFSFGSGATGYGAGYQDVNSVKRFGGLIGAGADKTFIVVNPGIMSASQLAAVKAGSPSPVQIRGIYAGSNANGGVPTIFSGITFRGNFQQSTTLAGLSGSAPAPYQGLFLFESLPGSFIQYSRFQGFGFVAKDSPPYETAAIESLRANYTIRRVEIDGRQAKEINAAQPISSGGIMSNREKNVKVIDSWLHHTRRSGWATHDNATSEGGNQNSPGVYYSENFQVENIANTTDSFAGTPLGFAMSNVEEVRRTFTWVRPRFNLVTLPRANAHIVIGTSAGNLMAEGLNVSDPVINDTIRGGCLIIRVIKAPNSLGDNPYYTAYQTGGFAALPIKVTKNNATLTPVLSTSYNPTIHTPDKYYVVIMG